MRIGRATLLGLHIVGLSVGLFLAIAAVNSVLVSASTDAPAVALSRSVTAGALIVVLTVYCGVLALRGFSMIAPLMFAISYGLVGASVGMFSRGMAKGFAPASPAELPGYYAIAVAAIVLAALVALVASWWTLRKSRFPLI